MVDPPLVVWILSILLFLTAIAIFSLTTSFVKRACLKQLSNDRKLQLVATSRFETTIKRAAFIIELGFLEVCAGLVVIIEATAVKYDVFGNQTGERCAQHFQYADKLRYLSCAVVGCFVLSIVRCLAQRYVLGRLSKSDVVSMTRVYLVPSTCFVTVLCVWSWIQLYGDREKIEADRTTVCYHVILNIPLKSFFLILFPVFWNLAIDYSDYKREKMRCTVGSQSAANSNLKYDSISAMRMTLVSAAAALPQNPSSHTLSETTASRSTNDKKGLESKATLFTDVALPVQSPTTPHEPVGDRFLKSRAESSSFDSFCDFLHMYKRMYLALVTYLASLMGAYTFMANYHTPSGMEDYTAIVFVAMLVITGMLRALQVMAAEAENRDGEKRWKIRQVNVSDV